jgi:hypothetical protein
MSANEYRAARFRTLGLMCIAVVAIGIAMLLPGAGNMAFMLMVPVSIFGRRIENGAGHASIPESISLESQHS